MHVSSTSSASTLWNLLAQRASPANASTNSSGAYAAASSGRSSAGDTQSAPPTPPPPPSAFDLGGLSTAQFAGGMPPTDPIASLDADGSGSVSADEFGLSGASDDVQALFKAIDADGSGELSTDEIDSFREQMMRAEAAGGTQGGDGAHGAHRPPPGPPPSSDGGDASDSTASSRPPSIDVTAFIQQLAQRYASMATAGSSSASSLSVSA